MHLIIGLGNPGRAYEQTRHNAGFLVVAELSRRWNLPLKKTGRRALYAEGSASTGRIVLAQPQTFMNESGTSVVDLVRWYKPEPANVIVIYDDVDLPVGRIRLRAGGSAGTHNGMRDILYKWQRDDFPRVRVGIGRPPQGWDIKDYVLGRPGGEEWTAFEASIRRAADAVQAIVERGVVRAQDVYNADPKPPRTEGTREGTNARNDARSNRDGSREADGVCDRPSGAVGRDHARPEGESRSE